MNQANDQRDDEQADIAAAFSDFDLGLITMIEQADLERFVKKYR